MVRAHRAFEPLLLDYLEHFATTEIRSVESRPSGTH